VTKYIVLNLNRDANDQGISSEYVDTLITIPIFNTKKEAFEWAVARAEKECNDLNEGLDKDSDRSFGIPEDNDYQKGIEVRVNCYFDDNNTELVTRRLVLKAQEKQK